MRILSFPFADFPNPGEQTSPRSVSTVEILNTLPLPFEVLKFCEESCTERPLEDLIARDLSVGMKRPKKGCVGGTQAQI
jgi:hypothetical protein